MTTDGRDPAAADRTGALLAVPVGDTTTTARAAGEPGREYAGRRGAGPQRQCTAAGPAERPPGPEGAAPGPAVPGAAHRAREDSLGLLQPEQLLAAISGHLDPGGGPELLGFARELGDLRAALLVVELDPRCGGAGGEVELRRRITAVVEAIDAWRVRHLPYHSGVRSHTHSLGQVIDHVAERFVDAWWTVRHSDDERLRRAAWFHLGQVREGYADLVDDIRAHRVELPLGWGGLARR